ncbi:hypothetical protein SpCBS45565_g04283 [Spizellomyces sp. 'palustris']|nr:hypothetical protein SpCBS45565_g04283 [Spizellomyces sp. 'palustris']
MSRPVFHAIRNDPNGQSNNVPPLAPAAERLRRARIDDRRIGESLAQNTRPPLISFQRRSKIGNALAGSSLYSAALQDHFARSLSLHRVTVPSSAVISRRSAPFVSGDRRLSTVPAMPCLDPRKRQRAKWEREKEIADRRKSPGKTLLDPLQRAPFACGGAQFNDEKEASLDPPAKPLTLAQRLGIVARPPPRLTSDEWETVKDLSLKRDNGVDPCPICQEPFTTEHQVLLSCSHLFHRACLDSYERYVQKKSCPLCREANYEKRLIFEGKKRFLHTAATIIQKTWRMWVKRRRYQTYRKNHPPNDPCLLSNWHMERLSDYTDILAQQVHFESQELQSFLREMDNTLVQSRTTINE